jgi:hypothetical protein
MFVINNAWPGHRKCVLYTHIHTHIVIVECGSHRLNNEIFV